MRMWVIAHNLKVLKLVIVNAVRLALELQLRQRARITSQLQVNLLNMIQPRQLPNRTAAPTYELKN
jgi:hypothetical protein